MSPGEIQVIGAIIGSCDLSDVSDPSNLGISNNLSESNDLRNTSDPVI